MVATLWCNACYGVYRRVAGYILKATSVAFFLFSSFNVSAEWLTYYHNAHVNNCSNYADEVENGNYGPAYRLGSYGENGCKIEFFSNNGVDTICPSGSNWDNSAQSCLSPVTCAEEPVSCSAETPTPEITASTNPDGSVTSETKTCYSDGSCHVVAQTTAENADGSQTTRNEEYTENSSGERDYTADETNTMGLETTDNSSTVTETNTNNLTGETTTQKTTAVSNSDGSTTITQETTTDGITSSETHTENQDGTTTGGVDCTDVAYINNPICRYDSPKTETSSCGDYALSVVGQTGCVQSCPVGYAQLGNDCIKQEVAYDPQNPSSDPNTDQLVQIASNTTLSLGVQRKIEQNTKNTVKEIQQQTDTLSKKLDEIIAKPVGGGGSGDTGGDDSAPDPTWSQSGDQTAFDHAAIDQQIATAKSDLSAMLDSIKAEASGLFSTVSVTNSSCSTTFDNPFGGTVRFCPSDYLPQMSTLANAMLAIAYLLALVILVRR